METILKEVMNSWNEQLVASLLGTICVSSLLLFTAHFVYTEIRYPEKTALTEQVYGESCTLDKMLTDKQVIAMALDAKQRIYSRAIVTDRYGVPRSFNSETQICYVVKYWT